MKNFSVKNGVGISAVIFAVTALIALPLRTYQFFSGTLEGKTGFYSANNFSVYALGIIITAAILFFIAFSVIKRKSLSFDREVKKRPVFGIFSLIAAAGFFACGITNFLYASDNNFQFIKKEFHGFEIIKTWNAEVLFAVITAVCAMLSAIFMIAIAVSALTGKTNGSEHKLISLAPVIFCIVNLVSRFNRTISYLRVSELAFELLMFAFGVMFFMAFAQLNARISDKNIEWKLSAYGLPAALFAVLCFVPNLILTVSGNTAMLYEFSEINVCDITMALFIIAAVFTRITDKTQSIEEPEETEITVQETTEE